MPDIFSTTERIIEAEDNEGAPEKITISLFNNGGNSATVVSPQKYSFHSVEAETEIAEDGSTKVLSYTTTLEFSLDVKGSEFDFSDSSLSVQNELPVTIAPGNASDIKFAYAPVVRGSAKNTIRVKSNTVTKYNLIEFFAEPYAVNELHISNATGICDEEVELQQPNLPKQLIAAMVTIR